MLVIDGKLCVLCVGALVNRLYEGTVTMMKIKSKNFFSNFMKFEVKRAFYRRRMCRFLKFWGTKARFRRSKTIDASAREII